MRPTTTVTLLAAFLLTAAAIRDLSAAPAHPAPATEKREDTPYWVVAGDWMPSEEEAVQDALKKSQTPLVEYLRSQKPPMVWMPDASYIRQRLWANLNANEPKFKTLGWKHAQEVIIGDGIWLSDTSWKEFRKAGMPVSVLDKLQGLERKHFATREECRAALDNVMDKEDLRLYEPLILNQANGSPRSVQIDAQELDPVVGTMYRAAVRVEVSSVARQDFEIQERQFQQSVREYRATSRQKILAAVLGGLVALLLAVAGYLRLEDATKGYYTRLLRLAVVAFVALVAAGLWVMARRL